MKSKRALMGFAALLIVLFHFYIPFGKSIIEQFLYRTAYVGVDIFFFVSACSLGQKKEILYWPFSKNRIFSTYVPFVLFTLAAAVYKGWSAGRFFSVIAFVDLFKRGGGAFVWFIPGILLFYIVVPFMHKAKQRLGLKFLVILLAAWAALVLILQYVCHYTTLMILLNRLPIFFIGFYAVDLCSEKLKRYQLPLAIAAIVIGSGLTYLYGFRIRLNQPVQDFYYILAIPSTIGIIVLFEYLYKKLPFKLVPLAFLGGITLEMYGLQMIFGFDVINKLYKMTQSGIIAFVCLTILLVLVAWLWHTGYTHISVLFSKTLARRKGQSS